MNLAQWSRPGSLPRQSDALATTLLLECRGLTRSHSASQHCAADYRQADLSALVLRVVTAMVLVIRSQSLTSQTDTGPKLPRSLSYKGYTSTAVRLGFSPAITTLM